MTKYDERFKLSVVQQYLDGGGGYTTLAHRHGLVKSLVRRWVERYRLRGADAFKKKFSHYSAEFKLSVLLHMWENELSYGQKAVQFDIRNPGVLSVWVACFVSSCTPTLAQPAYASFGSCRQWGLSYLHDRCGVTLRAPNYRWYRD